MARSGRAFAVVAVVLAGGAWAYSQGLLPLDGLTDALTDAPDGTPPGSAWTCSYEPTIDDDWHDDVLCTNGLAVDRPYLREGDTFVTEEEIMESAREYEAELNGGR